MPAAREIPNAKPPNPKEYPITKSQWSFDPWDFFVIWNFAICDFPGASRRG
jgi:hypothetical protein